LTSPAKILAWVADEKQKKFGSFENKNCPTEWTGTDAILETGTDSGTDTDADPDTCIDSCAALEANPT
jgi:hypothetical protein